MTNCIFCKIIAGTIPSYKIYEDGDVLAFLDAFPQSRGHCLVIPKKCVEFLDELDIEIASKIGGLLPSLAKTVKTLTGSQGYNVITNNHKCAGQIVPHVHFHLIPRDSNDGLKFEFKSNKMIESSVAIPLAQSIGSALSSRLNELKRTIYDDFHEPGSIYGEQFLWIYRAKVTDQQALIEFAKRLSAIFELKFPKTLTYNWFLNTKGDQLHVLEKFSETAAALEHGAFFRSHSKEVAKVVADGGLMIGLPVSYEGDAMKSALPAAPSWSRIAGFTRVLRHTCLICGTKVEGEYCRSHGEECESVFGHQTSGLLKPGTGAETRICWWIVGLVVDRGVMNNLVEKLAQDVRSETGTLEYTFYGDLYGKQLGLFAKFQNLESMFECLQIEGRSATMTQLWSSSCSIQSWDVYFNDGQEAKVAEKIKKQFPNFETKVNYWSNCIAGFDRI